MSTNPFENLAEELSRQKDQPRKDVDIDIDSGTQEDQEQKLRNERYASDTSDRKWLAF
jgi:hypothetical protein